MQLTERKPRIMFKRQIERERGREIKSEIGERSSSNDFHSKPIANALNNNSFTFIHTMAKNHHRL